MVCNKRLEVSLFFLRLTVFIVMLMWTIDKLLHPEHASSVYERYYGISNVVGHMMQAFGIIELILLICFLLGIWKTFTYSSILLFHSISTVSAYSFYLTPFTDKHLLFFAAFPMWAACLTLYLLRSNDTFLSIRQNEKI